MSRFFLIFIIVAVISCNANNGANTSVLISTDTAKLGKIIDLKTYRPTKVKFKYTYIDNSGANDRSGLPGPSDYNLEAVLYFDSLTYDRILTGYIFAGFGSPRFEKRQFTFDWLDNNIKNEINKTDTSYEGLPDYLFGSGKNGGIWFLNQKILLIKSSN